MRWRSHDTKKQKRLLDLFGKLEWDSSYNYKAERKRDEPLRPRIRMRRRTVPAPSAGPSGLSD
jgi:hypothetical protein